jgi:hypothetical protein
MPRQARKRKGRINGGVERATIGIRTPRRRPGACRSSSCVTCTPWLLAWSVTAATFATLGKSETADPNVPAREVLSVDSVGRAATGEPEQSDSGARKMFYHNVTLVHGAEHTSSGREQRAGTGGHNHQRPVDGGSSPYGRARHGPEMTYHAMLAAVGERGLVDRVRGPNGTRVSGCVSWRQTGGCAADGEREPDKDLPCDVPPETGASGYCECVADIRAQQKRCEDTAMILNCDRACAAQKKGKWRSRLGVTDEAAPRSRRGTTLRRGESWIGSVTEWSVGTRVCKVRTRVAGSQM